VNKRNRGRVEKESGGNGGKNIERMEMRREWNL
jgi:hypothetical protein